jgi:putative effector of murein hydrolase
MEYVFLMARLFPYWMIPLSISIFEVGLNLKRRKNRFFLLPWSTCVMMILLVILWIFFRGDLNSDTWVKEIFGLNSLLQESQDS